MQYNTARHSPKSGKPSTNRNATLISSSTISKPFIDTSSRSYLGGKKRCNNTCYTRPDKQRKGETWERIIESYLDTIITNYKNYYLNKCDLLLSPGLSNPSIITSRESSITSNILSISLNELIRLYSFRSFYYSFLYIYLTKSS